MKVLFKFIPVLLALWIITGCSASITTPPQTSPAPPATEEKDNQKEQKSAPKDTIIQTTTVRYTGQIDSNSIEAEVSGAAKEKSYEAFRLSEVVKAEFETYKLKTGDTLKIDYTVNEYGQKVITKCEVLSRTLQNSLTPSKQANDFTQTLTQTDTGRYIGQIDNNSIEIRISGVPNAISARAFKLSDSIKAQFETYELKMDDPIKFIYVPQDEGQPIIVHLEKI